MNNAIINNKIYKLEMIWRCSKEDKSKDMNGKIYPYPEEEKTWSGQSQFLTRLNEIQTYLENQSNNIILEDKKCKNCLLCDTESIITKRYNIGNYIWDNGMYHYVEKHNIKPSENFIEKIFNYEIEESINSIKLLGRIQFKDEIKYLKLDKNQIMILDALMKHGGYNKKYYDIDKKNIARYSEHAGFFQINNKTIRNIIVSGNTIRVDKGDDEIFLPMSTTDAYDYEYIFHTHPPTPKPGGRVTDGILYEFPSIGDILHFIDHFNDGKTIGSLVMTPEGLYNIRNIEQIKKQIKIDENIFYNDVRKIFKTVQQAAIEKYGEKFSTYTFYSQIAQDTSYISEVNDVLNKYNIIIDFYSRVKDFRGSWIIDTIYIPLYK